MQENHFLMLFYKEPHDRGSRRKGFTVEAKVGLLKPLYHLTWDQQFDVSSKAQQSLEGVSKGS